jgi:hypothetical protein
MITPFRARLGTAAVTLVALGGLLAPTASAGPSSHTMTPGVVRVDGSQNHFKLRNSNSAGGSDVDFTFARYVNTTFPVAGDWDGDGDWTVGVVRKDGTRWRWLLRNSNTAGGADLDFVFGTHATDVPIVGDWDGNGTTTVGFVRADGSRIRWKLRNANNSGGSNVDFLYGNPDRAYPMVGDWDGNGTVTAGVVSTEGTKTRWRLRNANSAGSSNLSFLYGAARDLVVAGDWDGNGTWTPGLNRRDGAGDKQRWKLRNSNTAGSSDLDFVYGNYFTDYPLVGDWDGS